MLISVGDGDGGLGHDPGTVLLGAGDSGGPDYDKQHDPPPTQTTTTNPAPAPPTFTPTVKNDDVKEFPSRLPDLQNVANVKAPATVVVEDLRNVSFQSMYDTFKEADDFVANGHPEAWADIAANIVDATTLFRQQLAAQEELEDWKGKTHDAALANVTQSLVEPQAVANGANALGVLLSAFQDTVFQTKWYMTFNEPTYASALQQYPNQTDLVKQTYDSFASTVMTKVWAPNIEKIASGNPGFTPDQPTDDSLAPPPPPPPPPPSTPARSSPSAEGERWSICAGHERHSAPEQRHSASEHEGHSSSEGGRWPPTVRRRWRRGIRSIEVPEFDRCQWSGRRRCRWWGVRPHEGAAARWCRWSRWCRWWGVRSVERAAVVVPVVGRSIRRTGRSSVVPVVGRSIRRTGRSSVVPVVGRSIRRTGRSSVVPVVPVVGRSIHRICCPRIPLVLVPTAMLWCSRRVARVPVALARPVRG